MNKKLFIALSVLGGISIAGISFVGWRLLSPPPPPPPSLACQSGWHEFLAGIDDQFPPIDLLFMPPTEPAIPSPGLQLFLNQYQAGQRDFDESGDNKVFGHTFEDIAPEDQTKETITEAFLEFRVQPQSQPPGPENDSVSLFFIGPGGSHLAGGWSRLLGPYGGTPGIFSNGWWWGNHQAGELVELNLASLPNVDGSTTDLISSLNAQEFLDLYIQDDTAIDYAKLRVRYSCIPLPAIEVTEPIEPFCTEDLWRCSGWSACTPAGTQIRTCTFVTDCPGVGTPKPAEEQTCKVPAIGVEPSLEPICTEDIWECGRWGECSTVGAQTRTCTLKEDCPFVSTPKPAESQTCVPPPPPKPPDLEAEKFFNSALHFGSSGSFTITVGNVGSGLAASPITVTDELPDGLTYLSFSDPYSNDWNCSASGQKVTCVYGGSDLSPGGFLPTLIINVAIAGAGDFPAAGDQVVNCAIVEHPSDKNSGNNQSCASAVVTTG